MSYRLERLDGPAIPIPSGRTEVGSAPDVGIPLVDPGVSPKHAVIFNVYGKLWIQSVGSAVVLVNGAAQQASTLKDGDQLRIGGVPLRVKHGVGGTLEIPASALPKEASPEPLIHTREEQMRGTGLMRQVESGTLGMAEMARYVMAFHRLSELVRSVNDRDGVIKSVTDLLRQVFSVKAAHYVEQRPGQSLRVMTGDGDGASAPSQTLIRRVFDEQVSYLVTIPVAADPDAGTGPGDKGSESMMVFGIRSAMAAPVPLAGGLSGALYVDTRDEKVVLRREDLALLEATASYVGAALDKAEQYIDLDQRVRSATQEVRQRNAELERRNAELRRLQSQREMLVSLLVHDIKAGLSAIRAGAELAHECVSTGRSEILGESVSAVRQGAFRLEAMVGDMLDVSRLEDGALVPRRSLVPLRATLEGVRSRWQAAASSRRLILQAEAPEGAAVHADPVLLSRVLDNLVSNALRFAPPDSTVKLLARPQPKACEILVIDQGEGVPDEERVKVFEKYGRVEGRSSGHGLGLYFCRLAVEAHGGTITVSGRKGDNRITFRLPSA